MKWLSLFLLIANIAVAIFFLGADRWTITAPEASAPLNVDQLSLRSASHSKITIPDTTGAKVPPALCVEWRSLTPPEFVLVREQLKNMTSDRVMSFAEVPLNMRQWVIFPPLPSRPAALAKLAELAAAGISDAFVVKDGTWINALSLGLYANEEAARRRVRELEDKGVLGTRIESQAKQGTAYYFIVRSEDADALKSLSEARAAYPNSTLSRVACKS
ncbi:MAG: SPOR domain-containing protein [Thiobacillaceae bacterium]